ncbi:recombinase family protein [Clostridium drakei]|nr:recombinase family protein [Clostridium drakei]
MKPIKAYGYIRISRDEDNKKESIESQRRIVQSYADERGIKLIDIFADNNVSGYIFERPELSKLQKLIDAGEVDVLIAKDLSRIGRNNALTILFVKYLARNNVRLLLKNDNYDSDDGDDTMIGIKTWINEMYITDLSKKIKSSLKQKQKDGIVIVPHYGYMKDPNNKNKTIIDDEVADVVRLIFKLYIEGYGCKKIAQYLNEHKIDTPIMHKIKKFGYKGKPTWDRKELWYETSIRRILHNDAYIGTLRCGVTKLTEMKGDKINVPENEQIIHENFLPKIISKEDFDLVSTLSKSRYDNNIRAKNEKIHKYAGILKCGDCGKGFVARRHTNHDGTKKITYVCASFHRYGSQLCSGHRIFEDDLDELVSNEILDLIDDAKINLQVIDDAIKEKQDHKKDYDKQIEFLKRNIYNKREELKSYLRQQAKGIITEDIFEELAAEVNSDIEKYQLQLKSLESSKEYKEKERDKIIKTIDVLRDIVLRRKFTNSDMTMLLDKITITNSGAMGKYGNPKLDLEITWNGDFSFQNIP